MTAEFVDIKNKYMASFSSKSIDLKTAHHQKDLPQLRMLLHKLAGSSGGYGFDELSSYCQNALELMEVKKEADISYLNDVIKQITGLLDNPL